MAVKERWARSRSVKYTTDESISRILPILQRDSRIVAAYLFGSRMKNSSEASDIDVAICTSRDFVWKDYYMLYGDLTKSLGSDRVDLVWLNEVDPILGFEVLKNGKVLFYKDADLLNEFELQQKKRYYDYVLYLNKRRRNRERGI